MLLFLMNTPYFMLDNFSFCLYIVKVQWIQTVNGKTKQNAGWSSLPVLLAETDCWTKSLFPPFLSIIITLFAIIVHYAELSSNNYDSIIYICMEQPTQ